MVDRDLRESSVREWKEGGGGRAEDDGLWILHKGTRIIGRRVPSTGTRVEKTKKKKRMTNHNDISKAEYQNIKMVLDQSELIESL